MRYPYTDEQDRTWHETPPDPRMDSPEVSGYWRRRAAHATGRRPDAPWVDIISAIEYAEHQRDELLAGELAVRELRRLRERIAEAVQQATAIQGHVAETPATVHGKYAYAKLTRLADHLRAALPAVVHRCDCGLGEPGAPCSCGMDVADAPPNALVAVGETGPEEFPGDLPAYVAEQFAGGEFVRRSTDGDR